MQHVHDDCGALSNNQAFLNIFMAVVDVDVAYDGIATVMYCTGTCGLRHNMAISQLSTPAKPYKAGC